MNRPLIIDCDGRPAPAPRDEYLLYQTLIGAWPLDDCGTGPVAEAFVTRIQTYMTKAMREAKLETSWTSPDTGYESAVATFVAAILSVSRATAFLAELRALAGRVAHRGMLNGLGQTVLKLTMPGVPDIYQGSELWDLRLVDPDNRGPVDFDNRQCALEAVQDTDPETLLRSWRTGEVKLALIARLLHHRRQFPRIYAEGAYVPVQVDGPAARNLCAFARQDDRSWLLVVVSRFLAPKGDIPDRKFWQGTSIRLDGLSLTGEAWNVLNDKAFPRTSAMPQGPIAVGDMLSTLPLCVLTGV